MLFQPLHTRRSSHPNPFAALSPSSLYQGFRVLSWCPVFTAAIRTTKTRVEGKIHQVFVWSRWRKRTILRTVSPSVAGSFLSVPEPLLGDDGGGPPHHREIVRTHWPLLGRFSQVFVLVVAEPGDRLRKSKKVSGLYEIPKPHHRKTPERKGVIHIHYGGQGQKKAYGNTAAGRWREKAMKEKTNRKTERRSDRRTKKKKKKASWKRRNKRKINTVWKKERLTKTRGRKKERLIKKR